MRNFSVGKIVKILILCLIIGIVLSFFGVGPEDFWLWLGDLAKQSVDALKRFANWAGPFVLIGAGIVIPIWLLRMLYVRMRRR